MTSTATSLAALLVSSSTFFLMKTFIDLCIVQGFPNTVKRCGGMGNFAGKIFLSGGSLRRSVFDHLNHFQSQKQYSISIKLSL